LSICFYYYRKNYEYSCCYFNFFWYNLSFSYFSYSFIVFIKCLCYSALVLLLKALYIQNSLKLLFNESLILLFKPLFLLFQFFLFLNLFSPVNSLILLFYLLFYKTFLLLNLFLFFLFILSKIIVNSLSPVEILITSSKYLLIFHIPKSLFWLILICSLNFLLFSHHWYFLTKLIIFIGTFIGICNLFFIGFSQWTIFWKRRKNIIIKRVITISSISLVLWSWADCKYSLLFRILVIFWIFFIHFMYRFKRLVRLDLPVITIKYLHMILFNLRLIWEYQLVLLKIN